MKDYATDKRNLFQEQRHAFGRQLLIGLVTGLLLGAAGWAGYDVYRALSPYVDSTAINRSGPAVGPALGHQRPDKVRKYIRIQLPLPHRRTHRSARALLRTPKREARASDAPVLGHDHRFPLGKDMAPPGEAHAVGWRGITRAG